MAKVTAPLFGFGARGQVGEALTFSKWRGIPYAKQYVVPSNPRSTKQTEVRDIFSALNSLWKIAPAAMTATWAAYAQGRKFLDRNAFQGQNVKLLYSTTPLTTMATFRASPGAKGGPAPADITPTPSDGQVSLALTLPEVPTGWTLVNSTGIAFIDQAPSDAFLGPIEVETDASTPESLVFTGLTNDELYVFSAWLEWLKPDGSTAYSISINTTSTPAM